MIRRCEKNVGNELEIIETLVISSLSSPKPIKRKTL